MVGGARKFRVSSRSMMVIVPLATLVVASGLWTLGHSRVIARQHPRVSASEHEASDQEAAEAKRAQATTKKKQEYAASDARLQQLYREIEGLSRINERLLSEPARPQAKRNDDTENRLIDGLP